MVRKKVFAVFGGFLAVMLVFTVLSRAVSGASMAKVETVRIKTGTIDHKVTGSGKVEAGKEVAVYTENGQRVKEICVREGQPVEEGELLFTIDMEELEEQILAAQQEMEKAKLQNQDAQSARNLEQKNRATAQNRAAEDYNQAVSEGDLAVSQAKAAWDNAEQALQEFLQTRPNIVGSMSGSGQEIRRAGTDSQVLGENQPEKDENSQSSEEDQPEPMQEDQDAGEDQPGTDENQGTGENQDPESDMAAWESQKAQLEQAAAEAKAAYEAALSSRTDNVKAAARALEDAQAPIAADSTSRQNEITRKQQELALQKLQALKEAEGKILSPVRGVVTQIAITTGDFTTEGTAMRLSDTSQGSRLVAAVDKANEEYVSKGSQVSISVSGSKDKISDYTVTNVTENEADQTMLDVVVDLPEGVLEAGTRAEIEIVQKSENYTSVIPIQALHEEQNGYYVLVMEEEQGVMGKEQVARRFEVRVEDKNSMYAALEDGLLTGEQEIISSSSRAIGDGSRVRKKEE